ncbi:diacylglycerol kinase [Corynebacterium ulceribovis]|uniref:diacylglycerol kinase n=1 Tax=Corynebacterium ulceribovis TaxID=487732 RepID=UPI00036A0D39|nr:diacylglycerol kinase [Corynebacterium ulceribovis]
MTETSARAYPLGYQAIRNIAMVTNPKAGHGIAQKAAETAAATFADAGVGVINVQGSSSEQSRSLIREVIADERIDALVVVGGDGMVNLALQEQAQTGLPLGIIPAGTGNDHAREYNLPIGDAAAAAKVVIDGFYVGTDLGRISEHDGAGPASSPTGTQHWFGTVMCSGFDSLVSDRVNSMRWPHGKNRYNVAIVREFFRFHSLPFVIELDDGRVLDGPITLAAFGNTKSYGGGMKMCPNADHADGLLDITVIGRASRRRAALAFAGVFKGTHIKEPEVSTYRAKSATVRYVGPPRTMNAYADGDFMAPLPVTVEVVQAAGKYLVPRP